MTVSYDAVASLATEERCGDESLSWTHTPSGTPAAIVVIVTTGPTTLVSGDNAVTAVTYGGVAMTLVQEVHKGTGEQGNVWLYELLSSIPTGAQSVVVTTDACPAGTSGTYPWFMGHSVSLASGGGTIARAATSTLSSDSTATPTISLDAGSNTGMSIIGGNSGRNAHTDVTAATDCTKLTGYSFSGGQNLSSVVGRQTTAATGSFAVGFAQTADDATMAAASYYEVAASGMSDPMGMSGFFGA